MKPLSAFRGAVFDLDGTLLDSMHIWVDIDYAFLRSRGLPEEMAYFERIKQISIREAADYTIARYSLSDTPEELIAWWMEMARRAYHDAVALKPGAHDYLMLLKEKGVRLSA